MLSIPPCRSVARDGLCRGVGRVADLSQGCCADLAEELPGVSPARSGRRRSRSWTTCRRGSVPRISPRSPRSERCPPGMPRRPRAARFAVPRVLTDRELKTLADWADGGCPEGNPKDGPPPREWSSDWTLGPPDLVLKMSEAYKLGASGADEYRVVVLPSGLTQGRWIAAADFKPGNMKVVHHILAAYDISGNATKLDLAEPGPGYATSGGGYGRLPAACPSFPPASSGAGPRAGRTDGLPRARRGRCRPARTFSSRSTITRAASPRPTPPRSGCISPGGPSTNRFDPASSFPRSRLPGQARTEDPTRGSGS